MTPGDLRYYLGDGDYKRSSERVRARTLAQLRTHPDWQLLESQECSCACGSVRHLAGHTPSASVYLVTVLSNGQTMVELYAGEAA